MGSSKKHKDKDREHKRKRKHRSRSRDRSDEKRRRRRDRSRERRDPDHEREEGELEDEHAFHNAPLKQEPSGFEAAASTQSDASLSIEETNELRAKLGLKPLEVGNKTAPEEKESLKDDIHVPAKNWSDIKKTEKIRERLEVTKRKREVTDKLDKVKTLGDSDSDEDAATWVRKNRMKQREKDRAAKTAKMLEEMDEEFGIGDLVEEEFKSTKKGYSSRDLKGLKVQHNMDNFKEGQSVILTLEDRGVLDEEGEETLVNVNMVDDEIAERNVENKKKKPDYNPYDDAEEDEYGLYKEKQVLSKYDEEISGEKKKSFALGAGGKYRADADRQMDMIKQELRAQAQSLSMGLTKANEYMTEEEMKFKKVKKKVRKVRKKKVLKADDLLPLPNEDDGMADLGRRRDAGEVNLLLPVDHGKDPSEYTKVIPGLDLVEEEEDMLSDEGDEGPTADYLAGVPLEEDAAETELQLALNKARKIKQKKDRKNPEKIAEQLQAKMEEESLSPDKGIAITLNSTSEFCRTLGEIPTYGQSGNRDELGKDELKENEIELLEQRRKLQLEEEQASGWNRVEIDETPIHIEGEKTAVLEEEPDVSTGMAGALALAVKKGFMEHEVIKAIRPVKNANEIRAQNYSIEDKRYDDLDEKYKKRDRYGGGGMLTEFKEKDGYKPEVKLEYCDDSGRNMNEKEAFRQLSHRFHGKGSGKKKTEKRAKKVEEEGLMKTMSSVDTPLNTVALLKEKMSQDKAPYIVLSGNKGFTNTMVKPTT